MQNLQYFSVAPFANFLRRSPKKKEKLKKKYFQDLFYTCHYKFSLIPAPLQCTMYRQFLLCVKRSSNYIVVGCPNFALNKFRFEAKLSETETVSLQFRETTQKKFRFISEKEDS